jgi:hypothetical protein
VQQALILQVIIVCHHPYMCYLHFTSNLHVFCAVLQSQDSQASQQSRVLMPLPESSFLARSKSALPTNLARSKAALPTNLQSTKQAKKRGAKPKK